MSGIEVQRFPAHMQEVITGLMIIELRKYNSATELLIGSQGAGSPGQGYNRSIERGVSVTKVAVCMKENGGTA